MTLFREKYRVESGRRPGFDYASAGCYFITICTKSRKHYFGEILDHKMILAHAGTIVWECWLAIPSHYPNVKLGSFIVMPDHVHGIISLSHNHIRTDGACRVCVGDTVCRLHGDEACLVSTSAIFSGAILAPPARTDGACPVSAGDTVRRLHGDAACRVSTPAIFSGVRVFPPYGILYIPLHSISLQIPCLMMRLITILYIFLLGTLGSTTAITATSSLPLLPPLSLLPPSHHGTTAPLSLLPPSHHSTTAPLSLLPPRHHGTTAPLVQPVQPDSLELAKSLRDSGNLKESLKLLETYYNNHPTDLYAGWVYAQTACRAKKNKLAREIYELTIWYHPENLYLQADYANMLVDIGKLHQALPYLENFLVFYPDNIPVQRSIARINYYKGRYKDAYAEISELKERDPADPETNKLSDQIRLAKSPWIGITGNYFSDNQPLQTISPIIESNIWLHPLSTLRFSARTPLFSQGGTYTNALWFQAGNSFFIWYGNWTVTLDAGVLKYPYKNSTTWTGNFELQKRSYKHLLTIFQAERRPYFATGSSIDTVVNEYHVAETIRWDNYTSWSGEFSYNWDYFLTDYNSIYALAGWILTPPLKASLFDFRLGYGISYSTSNKNNFVAKETLAEIIAGYDPDTGIEGIYYPYFTPKNQLVNSALLSIGIHPVKGFDIGISGNVGFFAKAKIPYLYLDRTGSGKFVIKKEFSNERYFPYTISAFASWQVSKKVNLRVDYRYNTTYFYNEHYAGLKLMIHIWNAQKRK